MYRFSCFEKDNKKARGLAPPHSCFQSRSVEGFTIVELIISIAIISALTSVVVISQYRFNNQFNLTNLTHDLAFTFRQAQLDAVNAKASTLPLPDGYDQYQVGHGISINKQRGEFTRFVDGDGNNRYTPASGLDLEVEVIQLPANTSISSVCYTTGSDPDSKPTCITDEDENPPVNVAFRRPSLNAIMKVGSTEIERLEITLSRENVEAQGTIVIEASGQMYTK